MRKLFAAWTLLGAEGFFDPTLSGSPYELRAIVTPGTGPQVVSEVRYVHDTSAGR